MTNDVTPSFHSASARRAAPRAPSTPKTPAGRTVTKTPNRKVSRNTPLTSTMKQGAPDFDLPGEIL